MIKSTTENKKIDRPTPMESSLSSIEPTRRLQIYNKTDDFSPNSKKKLDTYEKTQISRSFLGNALKNHYLFESLTKDDMDRIVDCMKPSYSAVGEIIINQGDLGDLFYCVEDGIVSATINGKEVCVYEPSGCFGELALIYNSPRAASIKAITACKLWTLELKVFRYILATTSSAQMITRCAFLKKCAFLDPLSNDQIGKLAGALDMKLYKFGEEIVRQGDVGNTFFIIERGSVKCTQIKSSGIEIELIRLNSGDYFGEMALMLEETRHASVIAIDNCKVLSLDKDKFDLLLGDVHELLAKRMRIRILQSVPLLAKLPEVKLVKLANVMRVQAFNDGAYIIKQGEIGSRFYIINEGEVRCTRNISSSEEEELIRLHAQEFFGERALITNEARNANAVASGHVECLVLDRTSFQTLLAEVQDDITDAISNRDKIQVQKDEEHAQKVGPITNFKYVDLKIMRTVGTGTFGRVKLVQHALSGQVAALKCMNKSDILASHQEKNIMNEKKLLYECSGNAFILKLLQTFCNNNQIFMLMEFVQGGELWSYIYEKLDVMPRCSCGGFHLEAAKFYAANVTLAFQHFEYRGIAYRDLKPENLLMNSDGYLKVIDFGFAKKFPYLKNDQSLDKTYTLCGTPEYLAPEIVMSKGYDRSVDHWALGCLIYELTASRTPFAADYTTKIFQNIVASDKCLSFPHDMDIQQVDVVKKLLTSNPAFRLGNLSGGINDIMRHPFFSTINWTALEHLQIRAPYKPPIGDSLDTSNFDDYEETDEIPQYGGDQSHFNSF